MLKYDIKKLLKKIQKAKKSLIALISGLFLLTMVLLTQNCGPVKFSQAAKNGLPCPVDAPCLLSNGNYAVDQNFHINNSTNVDILFVDDTSSSMAQEQMSLGTRFTSFISGLSGLNWQIAVTNTDVCGNSVGESRRCTSVEGGRGRFMGPQGQAPMYGHVMDFNIIRSTTPNGAALFSSIIQRNTELGSRDERAIFAANLAIDERNGANSGFFRNDGMISIVILSDEDERSEGQLCTPGQGQCETFEHYDLPQTLMNKVTTTWDGYKILLVDSIIIKPLPGGQACLNQQVASGGGQVGTTYAQLANMTSENGIGDICATDYSNMLANIGNTIRQTLSSTTLRLNYKPKAMPADAVSFNPPGNAVSWQWDGNRTVTMSARPANGTTVYVHYDYDPAAQ